MLNDKIKAIRKSKGLSQEELAIQLNVVRQTVSKWENGLSVPDSEMLIKISEVFDISVSTLLDESIIEDKEDELRIISHKLEIINLQLLDRANQKRKLFKYSMIAILMFILFIFILIGGFGNFYLEWDYTKIEYAVIGTIIHSFIWIFVRIAPIIFIFIIITLLYMTFKKPR